MRTVAKLAITPVKSMRLRHPGEIRLERFGVAENRRFYVADPSGKLLTGNRQSRLLAIEPDYDPNGERLALTFPDGAVVEGSVGSLADAVSTNFWGRPVSGRVVNGPWAEALSAHVGGPVRLVRTDRTGDGIDSHAASLFSGASAEELDRQAGQPGRALDRRRWRMLIE